MHSNRHTHRAAVLDTSDRTVTVLIMSVCILVLCLLAVPYGSYGGVTNVELSKIMQTLWNSDTNRLVIDRDIRINLQSKTSLYSSTDLAPSR